METISLDGFSTESGGIGEDTKSNSLYEGMQQGGQHRL